MDRTKFPFAPPASKAKNSKGTVVEWYEKLSKMKVVELKKIITSRGLPDEKLKKDIIGTIISNANAAEIKQYTSWTVGQKT